MQRAPCNDMQMCLSDMENVFFSPLPPSQQVWETLLTLMSEPGSGCVHVMSEVSVGIGVTHSQSGTVEEISQDANMSVNLEILTNMMQRGICFDCLNVKLFSYVKHFLL